MNSARGMGAHRLHRKHVLLQYSLRLKCRRERYFGVCDEGVSIVGVPERGLGYGKRLDVEAFHAPALDAMHGYEGACDD